MKPSSHDRTDARSSGRIGVLGGTWRGDVTTWGAVVPDDGSRVLDWAVAADDRWHLPRDESSTRHRRVDGLPIYETRVRVPGGDVVHRLHASLGVGAGGPRSALTLVEVRNESAMPVAVAFSRSDLLTSRPTSSVPVEGVDLPGPHTVVPLGHRSRAVVALAHDHTGAGGLPADFVTLVDDDLAAVKRGWETLLATVSRIVLPEPALAELVTAARCDALLDGGRTAASSDELERALAAVEAGRIIGAKGDALVELGGVVEEVLRRHRRTSPLPWEIDRVVLGFATVLRASGDERAIDDLRDIAHRFTGRTRTVPEDRPPEGIRVVTWTEDLLARALTDGSCELMPRGLPRTWFGAPFEAHRLPVGTGRTVSFAVRWHGERPALLWDCSGPAGLVVRGGGLDPDWTTTDARGEALLGVPPGSPLHDAPQQRRIPVRPAPVPESDDDR
jgi:hypothetical protein